MATSVTAVGLRLTCDCHRTQTMGFVQGGRLTVMLRSHGERHVVSIPLDKLQAIVKELEHKVNN